MDLFGHHHEEEQEERKLDEILEIEKANAERLRKIEHQLFPRLSSIKIAFQLTQGDSLMSTPVIGPALLVAAGQLATAVALGFDQLGNPWTGAMPPIAFVSDDTAQAIVTSKDNGDGTDTVAAVANGVANLSASGTSAEGKALTDVESITVNIPVVPPPVPVLSSIKIGFVVAAPPAPAGT